MFYDLNFLGLKRQLPIVKTADGISVAGFNSMGDIELLHAAGQDLIQQINKNKIKYDVILTIEAKGIPIAHEIATKLGVDYVVLRKEHKCYMGNSLKFAGASITSGKSFYYISEQDVKKLANKKVLFVDDVFSTGKSFDSIIAIALELEFKITACACILKEDNEEWLKNNKSGSDYKGYKIYYSAFLPLVKQQK